MQSKHTREHFRSLGEAPRFGDLALATGLCVYLCLSCALIGGCAIGFYKLMQHPNLDASAYGSTALPAPQLDAERPGQTDRRSGAKAAFAAAIEPAGKPSGAAAQGASKAKKSDVATLSSDTKRKRPVQPRRHDPMVDYAAQGAFGNYRPWGSYQTWSENRPSGDYQASGSYRPSNIYQGWGGYRNGH